MSYTWQVLIDGADAAGITLGGASISYGRQTVWEQPRPGYAFLQLLTPDAIPSIGDDYPDLAPGAYGARSGFTDGYYPEYVGVVSKLVVGAPITLVASTPTGFTDAYSDDYGNGDTLTRFTGRISAIDYVPGEAAVTAVDLSEALTRIDLVDWTRPGESEEARVKAIAAAAGVSVQIDGQARSLLIPDERPSTVTAWTALQKVAQDCGAVVYVDRTGVLHYRAWGSKSEQVSVPGDMVLLESIRTQAELGSVVNQVAVAWGVRTDGKQAEVTRSDPESVARFGVVDRRFITALATEADAVTMATQVITQAGYPTWNMPSATVTFLGAGDEPISQVAPVELQDSVFISPLPIGAPFLDYQALVLGYTERLDRDDWQLSFHLSPQGYVP